jgi:ABC-type lipoprotein release transport system permease subunit
VIWERDVILFKPLPWEYGVRNLFRRPLRSLLTLLALTTVVLLVFVVVGFIRGLQKSLAVSGDPRVALLFSHGMGENLEYSSIPQSTSDLVPASLSGIQSRYGQKYASPELYLGTHVLLKGATEPTMGLVRGVTPAVLLVRQQVELIDGRWPESGEILVGRLAGTKLGASPGQLAIGQTIRLEGRQWKISGKFAAGGSVFESELWCRLDDLQQAMKRQDLSLVALTLAPGASYAEVDLFCKERLDLELQALHETDYYAQLQKDYQPVLGLAWLMVILVSGAGVFAGLNTMYGAVLGRVRELATLQTLGFVRRAIMVSLVQEGSLLSMAAAQIAAGLAYGLLNGMAVRFTMGAFELRIDSLALLIGCGTGILLGIVGSLPPAVKAMRLQIVEALKSV